MLPRPRIHLLDKIGHVWPVANTDDFESGYWWRIGQKNADALVGGHLYLHMAQSETSHHGGVIVGYRIQADGKYAGRYIFRFHPTPEHIGIFAMPGRWLFRYKQLVL